jgi:hypothetical protein
MANVSIRLQRKGPEPLPDCCMVCGRRADDREKLGFIDPDEGSVELPMPLCERHIVRPLPDRLAGLAGWAIFVLLPLTILMWVMLYLGNGPRWELLGHTAGAGMTMLFLATAAFALFWRGSLPFQLVRLSTSHVTLSGVSLRFIEALEDFRAKSVGETGDGDLAALTSPRPARQAEAAATRPGKVRSSRGPSLLPYAVGLGGIVAVLWALAAGAVILTQVDRRRERAAAQEGRPGQGKPGKDKEQKGAESEEPVLPASDQFVRHDARVIGLAFTGDGKKLVAASRDGMVRAWDVSDSTGRLDVHLKRRLTAFALAPDGETALLGTDRGGLLRVNRLASSRRRELWPDEPEAPVRVRSVALSPRGGILACVHNWALVGPAAAEKGSALRVIHFTKGKPLTVALSHDGWFLAVGTDESQVEVHRAREDKQEMALTGHGKAPGGGDEFQTAPFSITALAFTRDAKTLASGGNDQTVRLWSLEEKRLRATVPHGSCVLCLSLRDEGDLGASGTAGGDVVLWDVATGAERGAVRGAPGPIRAIAFSPDGEFLAWSCGKSIRLLKVAFIRDGSVVR